jgi:hypothetical protein
MGGKATKSTMNGRTNMWPLILFFVIAFLIWFAISMAVIAFLVGVLHFHISSAAAPGIGFGVMGLVGNAIMRLGRRVPLRGKPPAQIAAEEFLSGRRDCE